MIKKLTTNDSEMIPNQELDGVQINQNPSSKVAEPTYAFIAIMTWGLDQLPKTAIVEKQIIHISMASFTLWKGVISTIPDDLEGFMDSITKMTLPEGTSWKERPEIMEKIGQEVGLVCNSNLPVLVADKDNSSLIWPLELTISTPFLEKVFIDERTVNEKISLILDHLSPFMEKVKELLSESKVETMTDISHKVNETNEGHRMDQLLWQSHVKSMKDQWLLKHECESLDRVTSSKTLKNSLKRL